MVLRFGCTCVSLKLSLVFKLINLESADTQTAQKRITSAAWLQRNSSSPGVQFGASDLFAPVKPGPFNANSRFSDIDCENIDVFRPGSLELEVHLSASKEQAGVVCLGHSNWNGFLLRIILRT